MLGLKPIKLLPARERVASALRKAIISKSIPEGAELTLENTAQELGVSVTPVREAFQILARDGLLEVKQNKCAIVLGVTEKRFGSTTSCALPWKGRHVCSAARTMPTCPRSKTAWILLRRLFLISRPEIILTTTSPSILRSGKLPAMKNAQSSLGTVERSVHWRGDERVGLCPQLPERA